MSLNQYIEHTALKADTNLQKVKLLCEEAIAHEFVGVCVPPYFVKHAKEFVLASAVKVVTVIGFPLGYQATMSKVEEAKRAIDEGADELDMVINIAALQSGDIAFVKNDIQSVATTAKLKNVSIKVIVETALISKEELLLLCHACGEIGVDYVKTSTGFANEGAKIEDIELMRQNLPKEIKIKASGGIKTKEQAWAMIEAGAHRLGTSSGIDLVKK